MCRSIKVLRAHGDHERASTTEEREAALQYIRKVSGYRAPSKANETAFAAAVEEVARVTTRLLDEIEQTAQARRV